MTTKNAIERDTRLWPPICRLSESAGFQNDFANAYFSPSQEYFANFKDEIGPVKKAAIAYGPNGVSRGTCNVTFVRPDGAKKAYVKLNGLLIDNRPIKVSTSEGICPLALALTAIQVKVLVDGDVVPEPPSLKERITKAQPKSAAKVKATGKEAKPVAGAKPVGKKGRAARPKSARPTKKTAEELDAEMADYFDAAKAAEANGAPASGGDAQMEDEIL